MFGAWAQFLRAPIDTGDVRERRYAGSEPGLTPLLFAGEETLQHIARLINSLTVESGKQLHRGGFAEFFPDLQQCGCRFAALQFVRLGQEHVYRQRYRCCKLDHLPIEILQLSPDIHDQDQPVQALTILEVIL